MGLDSSLTNCFISKNVKYRFDRELSEYFNSFEAMENVNIVEHVLRKEIDFEMYINDGVIKEHFPLHIRNSPWESRRSIFKY
jgi:hypothetical protein